MLKRHESVNFTNNILSNSCESNKKEKNKQPSNINQTRKKKKLFKFVSNFVPKKLISIDQDIH